LPIILFQGGIIPPAHRSDAPDPHSGGNASIAVDDNFQGFSQNFPSKEIILHMLSLRYD
jgi:hypothetical protein